MFCRLTSCARAPGATSRSQVASTHRPHWEAGRPTPLAPSAAMRVARYGPATRFRSESVGSRTGPVGRYPKTCGACRVRGPNFGCFPAFTGTVSPAMPRRLFWRIRGKSRMRLIAWATVSEAAGRWNSWNGNSRLAPAPTLQTSPTPATPMDRCRYPAGPSR